MKGKEIKEESQGIKDRQKKEPKEKKDKRGGIKEDGGNREIKNLHQNGRNKIYKREESEKERRRKLRKQRVSPKKKEQKR